MDTLCGVDLKGDNYVVMDQVGFLLLE